MEAYATYQTLILPSWAPPAWVFGPVWSVLYVLIAISFGAVFYRAARGTIPRAVAYPFLFNLAFNFSFTWIQFGLQNYVLASIDIILVLVTLRLAMKAIRPHMYWVVVMNIPYILWVAFATMLQLTITYLNF